MKTQAVPSASSRFSRFLLPLAVFAIAFALFAPSIRYPLVDLDDHAYITQNRIVLQGLSPDGVRRALSPSNDTATMYMPLLWISYMADISLFHASPENPAPFHAVNVALHALSALLLFFLLRRLHASPLWAAILALLWALHPLRVESVVWVTERKDCLAAFFGLAATLAYLAAWPPPPPATRHSSLVTRHSNKLFLFLALLAFVLGLLAKPSLVPLPLAWLALDVFPLDRIPSSPRAPRFFPAALRAAAGKLLFLLFALPAAWLAVAQHHAVSGALFVPWSRRLAAVAPNLLFYLRKTVLPIGLSPLVPEQWRFSLSTVLLSLAVCAVLAAVVCLYRKSLPSLLPGAVWLLLFFLPASGLQPLPMNTVADRFFYLPAIGLSIALAALLSPRPPDRPAPRPTRARIVHSAFCIALAVLAALAFRLLPLWSSTPALYRHVAATFPGHPVAVSELANEAMRLRGDFEEAAALLRPALEKEPENWFLRLPYADCLLQLESPDAAIDYIMAGHMPDDLFLSSQIFLTLANYEFFRGRFDDSVRYAEKCLAYTPADSTVRSLALSIALAAAFEAGDRDQALAFARQTRMYPDAASVSLENLVPAALFNWFNGRRAQTVPLFYRILDAFPERFDIWNNLLWGLATADWSPADPHEILRRAFHLKLIVPDPDNPGILDTLAAAQANAGNFDAALRLVDQAIPQVPNPDDPFRARLLHRRELFQNRTPYREKAFDRLFSITFGSPAAAL